MTNTHRDFENFEAFSYARFMAVGRFHAYQIRAVRSGGYRTARKFTSHFSRAARQDQEARRAVAGVRHLGNPRPYFFQDGMLYVLSFDDSIKSRVARYYPARGFRN